MRISSFERGLWPRCYRSPAQARGRGTTIILNIAPIEMPPACPGEFHARSYTRCQYYLSPRRFPAATEPSPGNAGELRRVPLYVATNVTIRWASQGIRMRQAM